MDIIMNKVSSVLGELMHTNYLGRFVKVPERNQLVLDFFYTHLPRETFIPSNINQISHIRLGPINLYCYVNCVRQHNGDSWKTTYPWDPLIFVLYMEMRLI